MLGTGLCLIHNPDLVAKGRSAGGKAVTAKRVRAIEDGELVDAVKLTNLAGIPAALERVAQAVTAGHLDQRDAQAIASLAARAIDAHKALDEIAERERKRAEAMSDEELAEAIRKASDEYMRAKGMQ